MSRLRATTSLLLAVAALASSVPAQSLYSRSETQAGPPGVITITLKARNFSPNSTYNINYFESGTPLILNLTQRPAQLLTDGRGYGVAVIVATAIFPNGAETLTVVVTGPGVPPGGLVKEYALKTGGATGFEIASAWPEFLQIQGVFCNPVDSASAHLQIDRTTDLDGDGIYGDVIGESTTSGFDPLDFPSEFSMDVNATGSNGCVGGAPPGVFWPGGGGRVATFLADNRVVITPSGPNCNFQTVMNFVQDMSFSAQFNGAATVFFTRSSGDDVQIGRDNDGDGSVTDAEITTFFDPDSLVSSENYSPDGVAADPRPTAANTVYWISDKSGATGPVANQGLYTLTDTNGNNRIDASEWTASWTGSTPSVMVDGVAVVPDELECLDADTGGGVIVNHTVLGVIFRWVDTNGDRVAQTGEVSNWFNYNYDPALGGPASTPSLPNANDDIINSVLPAQIPGQAGTAAFWRLNLIESVAGPNGVVTFVASTDFSGANKGQIFRCEDRNADGDVNDAGEVTLFSDETTYGTGPITGMDAAVVDLNGDGMASDDEIFVYGAFPSGPSPSCGYTFGDLNNLRLVDLDGDGDATSVGSGLTGMDETVQISVHPTGAFNRGLEVIPGRLDGGFALTFYSNSSFITTQPAACRTPVSNTFVEIDFKADKLEEGTQGTPFAGNDRFAVVTRGNEPNVGVAGLFLWSAPMTPVTLFFLPPFTCTIGLNPTIELGGLRVVPDANGVAEFPIPLPVRLPANGPLVFQGYWTDFNDLILGELASVRVW